MRHMILIELTVLTCIHYINTYIGSVLIIVVGFIVMLFRRGDF